MAGGDDDLFGLLDGLDSAVVPPLFVACGEQDALLDANLRFVHAARTKGVDVVADFGAGEHEWGYWDTRIRDVVDWLPLPSRHPRPPRDS